MNRSGLKSFVSLPPPLNHRRAALRDCADAGELTLKIDDRPPVQWPDKRCKEIADLGDIKRHKVTLYPTGKAQQSFSFKFSDFSSNKPCLFLRDWY